MNKLYLYLKEKSMTQRELSKSIGLTEAVISNSLKRGYFKRTKDQMKFADIVGVSVVDLYTDEEIKESKYVKELKRKILF